MTNDKVPHGTDSKAEDDVAIKFLKCTRLCHMVDLTDVSMSLR